MKGAPSAEQLASPVLSAPDSETLTWTWSGADPDSWQIYQRGSPDDPWSEYDNVAGANRSAAEGSPGSDFYIIGWNSASVPVTAASNIVTQQ